MDIKNNSFSSIEQVTGQYFSQKTRESDKQASAISFDELLKQKWQAGEPAKSENIRFSKHAGERLKQRNIVLSEEQLRRLNDGAQKAYEKGIKDSLVIMDSLSFIVNTKSNTVITAMEQDTDNENIYTNIDGAVII